ncbi:MAG: hypothetical protein ABIG96_01350 [Candidatus Micrarchaeota archaeon]
MGKMIWKDQSPVLFFDWEKNNRLLYFMIGNLLVSATLFLYTEDLGSSAILFVLLTALIPINYDVFRNRIAFAELSSFDSFWVRRRLNQAIIVNSFNDHFRRYVPS